MIDSWYDRSGCVNSYCKFFWELSYCSGIYIYLEN